MVKTGYADFNRISQEIEKWLPMQKSIETYERYV
jgi:hypothetical protein